MKNISKKMKNFLTNFKRNITIKFNVAAVMDAIMLAYLKIIKC